MKRKKKTKQKKKCSNLSFHSLINLLNWSQQISMKKEQKYLKQWNQSKIEDQKEAFIKLKECFTPENEDRKN